VGGVLTKEEYSNYVGHLFINKRRVGEPFRKIVYIISALNWGDKGCEFTVRPLFDRGYDIPYDANFVLKCSEVIFLTGPTAQKPPTWLK
jgi:hypothetical protein